MGVVESAFVGIGIALAGALAGDNVGRRLARSVSDGSEHVGAYMHAGLAAGGTNLCGGIATAFAKLGDAVVVAVRTVALPLTLSGYFIGHGIENGGRHISFALADIGERWAAVFSLRARELSLRAQEFNSNLLLGAQAIGGSICLGLSGIAFAIYCGLRNLSPTEVLDVRIPDWMYDYVPTQATGAYIGLLLLLLVLKDMQLRNEMLRVASAESVIQRHKHRLYRTMFVMASNSAITEQRFKRAIWAMGRRDTSALEAVADFRASSITARHLMSLEAILQEQVPGRMLKDFDIVYVGPGVHNLNNPAVINRNITLVGAKGLQSSRDEVTCVIRGAMSIPNTIECRSDAVFCGFDVEHPGQRGFAIKFPSGKAFLSWMEVKAPAPDAVGIEVRGGEPNLCGMHFNGGITGIRVSTGYAHAILSAFTNITGLSVDVAAGAGALLWRNIHCGVSGIAGASAVIRFTGGSANRANRLAHWNAYFNCPVQVAVVADPQVVLYANGRIA